MSTMATHERKAAHSVQHSPLALTDMFGTLVFGFSWSLVMAIGLAPLAEASLSRLPSITMPTTIAFFVAFGSAFLLRRRYSWMGLCCTSLARSRVGSRCSSCLWRSCSSQSHEDGPELP